MLNGWTVAIDRQSMRPSAVMLGDWRIATAPRDKAIQIRSRKGSSAELNQPGATGHSIEKFANLAMC